MQRKDLQVCVISDLHLGTFGCHANEIVRYLKGINPKILVLNGDIIDMNGHPAVIRARLRGFSSRAYISRNFYPFQKFTKKHLALQIGIGGGYSQTYIDYQVDQGTVPQIEGNNKTGYDKLAGGYQIAERIRIQYFNFNIISNNSWDVFYTIVFNVKSE